MMANRIYNKIPWFKAFGKTWSKPNSVQLLLSAIAVIATIFVVLPTSILSDVSRFFTGHHNYEDPKVYFGAGIKLQISESEIATVFGDDDCRNLRSKSLYENGCTLLTGKSFVNVRLLLRDGSVLNERWRVTSGVGLHGKGIRVERPNGWIIREAGA